MIEIDRLTDKTNGYRKLGAGHDDHQKQRAGYGHIHKLDYHPPLGTKAGAANRA